MPSSIELALATLLPTVLCPPLDLVSLANSLLAQSRAKAASLKPEEEIGRIYAVAHIACERLKKRLDLDIDKPKPPCPPKVYKKLYAYLDFALTSPTTPRSVRKRDAFADDGTPQRTPVSGRRGNERTPRQALHAEESRKSPTTGTKRGRDVVEDKQDHGAVPGYVMPMIRAICKATSTPKAAPHMHVGAAAVFKEIASRATRRAIDAESASKRRRRTPLNTKLSKATPKMAESSVPILDTAGVVPAKWPALLVAIHAWTVARATGCEVADEEGRSVRGEAMRGVRDFSASQELLPEEVRERLDSKLLLKDVAFYMLEAEDCGWLEMEWYQNIPQDIDLDNDDDDDDDDDGAAGAIEQDLGGLDADTEGGRPAKTPLRRSEKHRGKAALGRDGLVENEVGAAGLLPGQGTMFQPAVDWLRDDRRAEYLTWRQGIMNEIAMIEANA